MVSNARIQDLIRENRPDEIVDAIEAGEYYDMQSFAQSLIQLVLNGVVEREVGANAATNRHDFLVALEAAEKVRREAEEAEAQAASTNGDAPSFAPVAHGLR
jgi:Tfp pilus assembly ATPase PilU